MRQLNLIPKPSLVFGGSLLARNTSPKCARPLDTKRPVHLVLRAERSVMRHPRHFARVNAAVERVARKRHVTVYEYANAGNHLHLLLKFKTRRAWNAFIRELTGVIARLTAVPWTNRPFTRVVAGWRRAFARVAEYIRLNTFEADRRLSRPERAALRHLRTRADFRLAQML